MDHESHSSKANRRTALCDQCSKICMHLPHTRLSLYVDICEQFPEAAESSDDDIFGTQIGSKRKIPSFSSARQGSAQQGSALRSRPRTLTSAFRPRALQSLPSLPQFTRNPPLKTFTFRQRNSKMNAQAAVEFTWSTDIEEIDVATDVWCDRKENRQAVGYIGSGHTKLAIYVSICLVHESSD
jgi:hypothetical protein